MLALVALLACGSPEPAASTASIDVSASEVPLSAPAFTNAQGELVCPVMGDVIESRAAAVGHTEHDGRTYFFCCDSCQYLFADDPERYANGAYIEHLEREHDGHFGMCNHVL